MASAFLGLAAAAVAALGTAPAVLATSQIRRGRDLPMPAEWDAAIDVHVLRSRADAAGLAGPPLMRWATDVGIDVRVRASVGTDGETAVDALLESVFARLATTAPPAGAIGWTLSPAINWDIDEADQSLVRASLVLGVDHFTSGTLAPAT